ncbi:MAG: SDR family oxidoreductase [Planctomycetaceae bacterium]|nr:SDR family oxidoreductase [Planctomycetaceae bacterium]
MSDLKDRVAIVTGGNQGIGYAIAESLARAGCRVAIGARNVEKLNNAAARLNQSGGTILAAHLDVADESSVEDFFAKVDREWGAVDILVNNAGAFDGGPVEDLTLEAWDRVIGACLTGTFLCSRAAFRRMKRQGRGRILNIGSISAQRPRLGSAPYTAAKFGVWGLTQALALEGREHGIVCSCLHPGNVLVERRMESSKPSDDEPMMATESIAKAAMAMLQLPDDVNFLEAIVLPRDQLYVGRG